MFWRFPAAPALVQGAHQLDLGRIERAAAQGVGQGNQVAQAGRLLVKPVNFSESQYFRHPYPRGVADVRWW